MVATRCPQVNRPAQYAGTMSKTRLLAFGMSALLLAACGPVNPGAAAVVDGTRISMAKANDYADSYCLISLMSAQQQGTTSLDNAMIRRQALTELIVAARADSIAKKAGYDIQPQSLATADLKQIKEIFGDEADQIIELIERNQRTSAIAAKIAAEAGVKSQDQNQLAQAGFELLMKQFEGQDLKVDPRFGLSDGLEQTSQTGSLSTSISALENTDPASLPQALQCKSS